MYLSRLTLDLRYRDARAWLGDCHKLHRAIMSGFAQAESEAARGELGVLFRVETPVAGAARVLVQSRSAPRWALETRAVPAVDPARNLEPLTAGFVSGATYRFRLRANPTRRVHPRATQGADLRELDTSGRWRAPGEVADGERTGIVRRPEAEHDIAAVGKRVELRREEDRVAWLARRGREQDGFELLTVHIPGDADADDAAGGGRDIVAARADPADHLTSMDRKLTFATALFEGNLRITDTAAFRHAFESGIGPGKAFGCGLLSLAPIT